MRLILASASPRRKTLLSAAGLHFEVIESGVDETRREGEPAADYALRMAEAKAQRVSTVHRDALVLGADTIVVLDAEILLKPADPADAHRTLRALSARTHTVITAFALAVAGEIAEASAVPARVTFRTLSDSEIDAYIATGEPFDKAGAYGIQGAGADFIRAVDGARDTVMGLPVLEVLDALRRQH